MKKILFVAATLGIGGMERVLVDISNELVERGYDVTILTYFENEGPSWSIDLDKRVHLIYREPKDVSFMKKIPYVHRYYKKEMWEHRASPKTLYKYYVGTKEKYDVEIAFCRGPAVKIISGSTNKDAIKLTWVHNDYKLVDPSTITKFFNSMDEARNAYKFFDKIVAVSEEARKKFVEVIGYEEKTITIYNMLPIERINRKKNEKCPVNKKRFTAISVARLIPAKGYDTLLKAVKRLNDEGLQFDLWLIGSGGMNTHEVEIRNFVKENKMDNVSFMGRQMNPYCYMDQADVYICSSWREGFSISVAEAMACGLPVISTNCTGPTEILDNGKFGILIEYSEEAMYAALKNVILHPEVLEPYKAKSLERSKRFSSEVIIEEIMELFE